MFKQIAGAPVQHASETDLLAYADGDTALGMDERTHITSCATCTNRAVELREMRRLLQATALQAQAPPSGLAREALNRVRHRRAAAGHINELFGVLAGLLGGFSALFSRERAKRG